MIGDRANLGIRPIRVARLLKAERPESRQWGRSRQISVSAHDALWIRGSHDVVIEATSLGAKAQGVGLGLAEIKETSPGVVEEQSEAAARLAHAENKWNRFIERIGRL